MQDETEDFGVLSRGSAGLFLEISENGRCSMGFRLEAPVGK